MAVSSIKSLQLSKADDAVTHNYDPMYHISKLNQALSPSLSFSLLCSFATFDYRKPNTRQKQQNVHASPCVTMQHFSLWR